MHYGKAALMHYGKAAMHYGTAAAMHYGKDAVMHYGKEEEEQEQELQGQTRYQQSEDSIILLSFSALHRYHICYNYAFSMLEIVIVGPKHTNHAYTGKICPMDTRIQISRQKDLYYDAMHYGKIFCDKISVIDSLTSNFAAIGWVFDMYMPPAML